MIKHRRFLTAFICVILSLITALCFVFSGCGKYTPPETDNPTPSDPGSSDTPGTPENPAEDTDFSIQLKIIADKDSGEWVNFTYDYYEASDGNGGVHEVGWIKWETIQVQWTNVETNSRHYSSLDNNGKAVCADLDGDYKVTLINVPTGFTYEPNTNLADNLTPNINVYLYQIQQPTQSYQLSLGSDNSIKYNAKEFSATGAYRATLKNKDDRVMFVFKPTRQGTYSLTTLVDVTKNKINPKLTVYTGQITSGAIYHVADKDDGGAENTYTKNIMWTYELAVEFVGNALFFELYSTSLDGNSSYPLVLDILVQRNGDYAIDYEEPTAVSATEDFTKTPAKPSGTFTWAAYHPNTEKFLLDSSKVILNTEEGRGNKTVAMGSQARLDDGYYYFYDYDEDTKTYTLTDRLYVVISQRNQILDGGFIHPNVLSQISNIQGKNYRRFINTYKNKITNQNGNCYNADGAYPVNAELKLFLQDYCLGARLFNDSNGYGETTPVSYIDENGIRHDGHYKSDEESMWMFACGYYRN